MRIAVIGGDGIGPEVIAEAIKVLRAAAADTAIETTSYDLGASRYARTGEILPASVLSEIASHDAILFGAVGDPSVPSGVLERGLVLRLRFEFDQYVSLRPVRLFPGVDSPLAGCAAPLSTFSCAEKAQRAPTSRPAASCARERRLRSRRRRASTPRSASAGSPGTPSAARRSGRAARSRSCTRPTC